MLKGIVAATLMVTTATAVAVAADHFVGPGRAFAATNHHLHQFASKGPPSRLGVLPRESRSDRQDPTRQTTPDLDTPPNEVEEAMPSAGRASASDPGAARTGGTDGRGPRGPPREPPREPI